MDWWKKKKQRAFDRRHTLLQCRERGAMLLEDLIKCCNGRSNPIKFFSADMILKATDNFSKCNHVSGTRCYDYEWFSGKTDNQRMIIMKKYTYKHNSSFCRDVAISSMVSGHKNFMKLAGCCLELEYPLMIYYAEKEQYSLLDLEKIVSWKRRMKIAEDIATALAYLHTAFSTPFVYRIISMENILIDEDGVAKLTDFSCCISIPQGETFVKVDIFTGTNAYIGTSGFIEPDYWNNGIVSEKTDAYGFGMFMLMLLIGGRERLKKLAEGHVGGFHWENPMLMSEYIEEGRLVDKIADLKMLRLWSKSERCGMEAFLLLSLRCFGCKGEVPTMVEVAKELKKIQKSSHNASSSC